MLSLSIPVLWEFVFPIVDEYDCHSLFLIYIGVVCLICFFKDILISISSLIYSYPSICCVDFNLMGYFGVSIHMCSSNQRVIFFGVFVHSRLMKFWKKIIFSSYFPFSIFLLEAKSTIVLGDKNNNTISISDKNEEVIFSSLALFYLYLFFV